MDRFLYERLPMCHARIYKGFLQNSGRNVIPKAIDLYESGLSYEEILERIGTKLSRDVYRAVRDISYLKRKDHLQHLKKIKKRQGVFSISGGLDTILLQLIPNQRWAKRYHTDTIQYDMILAIPKWSRVVSISTSQIEPDDLLSKIKQFDKLRLTNYHFFEFFNKLHGDRGRHVELSPIDEIERANTIQKLNFLKRNIADIQLIAKSANLRLFTSIPDISGDLRFGMYFITIGKISNIREVRRTDAAGIDPYNFIVSLEDMTGKINCRLNTINQKHSLWNNLNSGWLQKEFNQIHTRQSLEKTTFANPLELQEHDGYFLVLGNWFLGDDVANMSLIIPLHKKFDHTIFSILGYMNTRKKATFDFLKKNFPLPFPDNSFKDADTFFHSSLVFDKKSNRVYYKEPQWNATSFLFFLRENFENPHFSKILEKEIDPNKFKKFLEYVTRYFEMNDELKSLYLGDDFSNSSFHKLYTPVYVESSSSHQDDGIKFEIDTMPDIILPVSSWKNIQQLVLPIKEEGYRGEQIFDWGNGGSRARNTWYTHRHKHYSVQEDILLDEIQSALYYLAQARGSVFVPERIYDNTFPSS